MSLWKRTQFFLRINSPRIFSHVKLPLNQETSLCICHRASYTVEAAVVIPFMAAFLAAMLFFFRILQVQTAVEQALFYAGRKTAVEASVVTSEEALLISAKGYLLYALKDEKVITDYVRGGAMGILLLGSCCQENEIVLKASYEVGMPVAFWDIGKLQLYSHNTFTKWSGNHNRSEEEEWLYVTPNGVVYHVTPVCRVLDLSIREVSLSQIDEERGKNGQKYYACERCCQEEYINRVYCTDYGTLYHMDVCCSYLKRTINKIKKEEVGERYPCSYCN